MKVVIINRSDHRGGAAIASARLMESLRLLGVDARMLVVDAAAPGDHVATVGSTIGNKWHFLSERLQVMCRNGFNRETLFMIDPATCGTDLSGHPWVRQADVIVLAWINQGMLSLRHIERLGKLGKPLVWVMHDMWCATGVCHHAGTCSKFCATCMACPLTGKRGNDLSTATQRRKAALYASVPIHFVAVSNWLAGRCSCSSLMAGCNISVIPNPFPASDYAWQRADSIGGRPIPKDKLVLAMGAARLDDPIKGFPTLIETMRHLRPDVAQRVHLVLYGDIRDASLLKQIDVPTTFLGRISHPNEVLAAADVVLSTSHYETLPTTLVEGLASGCLAVTTGNGGQRDIVDHRVNGYIASDAATLADGIAWAAQERAAISRQALHDDIAARFGYDVIASRFEKLFRQLHAHAVRTVKS